jgi:nicotinamidase-related amidase
MADWTLTGRTALLIVHMQNAITKSPSPLDFMGHPRATAEDDVIPHIAALLDAFREKGLPVLYLVAFTPDDSLSPVYGLFWRGIEESRANKLGTRDVEIVEELTPRGGEPVLYNWPFDLFRTTDLEQRLQKLGIETVVLVGVSTGMAINVAAYQLAERFYNLIIPSDCITDGNRELHEVLLAGVLPVLGLVTTHEDVIAHL